MNKKLLYPLTGYGSGDFCAEVSSALNRLNEFLEAKVKSHHPETTGERLKHYMTRAGWNASAFTHRTQLGRRLFSRIIKDPKAKYAFHTCLSIAVGLGLTYRETTDALALSGMGFDNGSPDHFVYRFILSHYPRCSMEFFNAVCEAAEVTVLGSGEYRDRKAQW